MKKSLILLVLPLLLAVGCGDDNRPVAETPSPEDIVIANGYALRDSAEAYAAQNGQYPSYLHRSSWLYNPFNWTLTEPAGGYAINPGDAGYMSYWDGAKYAGYLITGFGKTSEVIRLRKNYPDSIMALDSLVMANCYIVQSAADSFAAENNGVYADDMGLDATPAGNTIVDFLPGGVLLENPFYRIRMEPVDGMAAIPCQTGYNDVKDNSRTPVGYTITGFGMQQRIIAIVKYPGQQF